MPCMIWAAIIVELVLSVQYGRGLHSFTLELNLSNSRTHA
jgi:hypothetical protein